MIIAIDFDGTLVEHKYPEIGKVIPFAFDFAPFTTGQTSFDSLDHAKEIPARRSNRFLSRTQHQILCHKPPLFA